MEAFTRPNANWFVAIVSRPYAIAFVLMYGCFFIPFMTLKRDWEKCTLVEAGRMWAGGTIYGHDDFYPYPPLPAFLAVPFAQLPVTPGQILFYSLNMACLFLMVLWSWLLSGGGRLQGSEPAPWREHVILLLGMLCGFSFAWNCLAHHQLDLLVGAALIGGCLALQRERGYLAALGFGLAAALKGPALLWAPYLAWRGRWREALCVVGVFVGLNLLPSFVVPAQWQRLDKEGFLLVEWAQRFLQPMGQSSEYPFFWYTESNQSLMGDGYRWLCTTWDWNGRFQQRLPVAHPASPAQLKGFFLTCAGLLVVGTMLLQRRRHGSVGEAECWAGRKSPFAPRKDVLSRSERRLCDLATSKPALPGRLALECGMVLMLMLLLSPMAGKAHFGIMLVPGLALARLAVYQGCAVLRVILAMGLMAVLFSQNVMGDYIVCVAMWHGTVTWAALLMWAGCGYALVSEPKVS